MKKNMTSRLRSQTLRLRSGQAGMSLVEATIILMVLATLTAVIAPSMGDYVEESRNTKAKEDVEAIGMGIARLLRDTGLPCLSLKGNSCIKADKVELLLSGTSTTANLATSDTTAYASSTNFTSAGTLNWAGATSGAVGAADRDVMDPHLVTNVLTGGAPNAYTAAGFTGGGGPRAALGWRGAYLNGPIDVDPWGFAYQANTVFAGTASDATDGTGEGALRGGWSPDMLVISAGSNGNIQTPFGQATVTTGTTAVGDDVLYVIQGSTR